MKNVLTGIIIAILTLILLGFLTVALYINVPSFAEMVDYALGREAKTEARIMPGTMPTAAGGRFFGRKTQRRADSRTDAGCADTDRRRRRLCGS